MTHTKMGQPPIAQRCRASAVTSTSCWSGRLSTARGGAVPSPERLSVLPRPGVATLPADRLRERMPIRYSLIARGQVILCSSQDAGDFSSANLISEAEKIVNNVSTAGSSKTTYTASDHFFHVVIENGTIFLCATDAQFRKPRAFAFLEEIQSRFMAGSLAVRSVTARPMELQRDFGAVLASQMKKFSTESGDHISKLQAQVEEVRGVMTQNIEKVLEREEKLGDLIEKTGDLEASANSFKKTARAAHKVMWWKNMKMKIILGSVILVILIVIVVIILYSTGVFKGSNSSDTTTVAPTTTTTRRPGL